MRNLGLRALHCNSRVHCQGVESRRLVRPDGANVSSPYLRKVLADFDAFSDLPFYWLPKAALSAVGRYADSRISYGDFHLGAATARLQSDFPLWWGKVNGVA